MCWNHTLVSTFEPPLQYPNVTEVLGADLHGMKCSSHGSIDKGCCSLSSTFSKRDVGGGFFF